jgi:hypothetical protein
LCQDKALPTTKVKISFSDNRFSGQMCLMTA